MTKDQMAKSLIPFVFCSIMMFISSLVFTGNISWLVPINDSYGASWPKVVIAIMFFCLFAVLAWRCARRSN